MAAEGERFGLDERAVERGGVAGGVVERHHLLSIVDGGGDGVTGGIGERRHLLSLIDGGGFIVNGS